MIDDQSHIACLALGQGNLSRRDTQWQKAEAMMIGHLYAHVYIQST